MSLWNTRHIDGSIEAKTRIRVGKCLTRGSYSLMFQSLGVFGMSIGFVSLWWHLIENSVWN